jgi:hypothetical protein
MNIFFVILVALISANVLAQSTGLEFKGVALGSTVSEFKEKHPVFYCKNNASGDALGDTHCGLWEEQKCLYESSAFTSKRDCRDSVTSAKTYANVPVKEITAIFYNDTLSMVQIKFSPDLYSLLYDAASTKHGEPVQEKTVHLQNRLGAIIENKVSEWKIGDNTIRIQKYTSNLDTGTVKIFRDAYFEEFKRRRSAKNNERAMDM